MRDHVTFLLAGRLPVVYLHFSIPIFCAIALPRGGPIWLTFLAFAGAVELCLARRFPDIRLEPFSPILWAAAFAGATMISSLWAPSVADALGNGSILVIAVLAALACGIGLFVEQRRLAEAAHGLCAGIFAGLALVAFETVSDLYLTRTIMSAFPALQERYLGKHIDVVNGVVTYLTDNFMNRSTLAATMLLAPGLILARRFHSERIFKLMLGGAAVYAACVLALSRHQSSQLALLVGAAAAVSAWRSIAVTRRLVVAGWCCAVLLSPVFASAIDAAKLQHMAWPVAIEARLAIWADAAREIRLRPFFGIGAGGAETLVDQSRRPSVGVRDRAVVPPARHTHNVYLQVWYELGLLGVVPFLLLGLSLIHGITALPQQVQRYALVYAAMAAAMLATSYGLWQSWVQCVYAIGGVLLIVSARQRRSNAPIRCPSLQ